MLAYVISDNMDTLVGMRLAGVEGVHVGDAPEATAAIEKALKVKELGVLLVTEKAAAWIPELMQRVRERGEFPLVVEIPDRHGSMRGADFLTRYVRDAIGVKME